MANFCTNCGTKLGKDDNFCPNCGAKIDKSDINRHNPSFNQWNDNSEKNKAKKELKRVVGGSFLYNKSFGNALHENGLDVVNAGKAIRQQVEKEIDSGQIKSGGVELRVNQLIFEYKIKKEDEEKKLKMIDDIFESAEIKSEISKNNIDQVHVSSIKDRLKDKIIDKRENMGEEEIKLFIKTELENEKARTEREKARIEREKARVEREKERIRKEIEKNERVHGGYCSSSCIHCQEELLDSSGGIVGDYVDGGMFEYYCSLGHSLGGFCEDYKE